jgi:DNA repair exonuclease SbcCD ATPase subunit
MMLTKIIIRGFRQFRKKVIKFSPNVTSLVGKTNSGKSTVINSLRWVALNQPRGDKFIRWGHGKCSVVLLLDSHRIKRGRGSGENSYQLDGTDYKAVHNNIPDTVTTLLNTGPVNFQRQHDPAFWFSLSPPEVSRRLNAIINLDSMDKALAFLGAELRRAKAEEAACEERLKEAAEKERVLSWVVECNAQLQQLQDRERTLEKVRKTTLSLAQLVKQGVALQNRLRTVTDSKIAVQSLGKRARMLLGHIEQVNKLQNVVEEIVRLEEHLCHLKQESQNVKIQLQTLTQKGCPLCGSPMKLP